MSEPIVVDTVEKAFQIFGDPNFQPKGSMEWGSHPDHAAAVAAVSSDLTNPYHIGKEAWEALEAAYRRKKPSMRSIDDDWMT